MENGVVKWRFKGRQELIDASAGTVRAVCDAVVSNLNPSDERPVIALGYGDPSSFPSYRTSPIAEDAVVDSVRSAKFNSYNSTVGILPARRAVAEHLSKDLPYKLSPDDVYITIGCSQATEIILAVLSSPGANILLPRPSYPYYEARAAYEHLQVCRFDLLQDKGWEVDLDSVQALADENTVAMVIINPGNPCGCVYSYEHLEKVAKMARKLGIIVIADEVYAHMTFGSKPFVPMGVFGSLAPVVTMGSISKRWIVPGWRIGWLVLTDPNGYLRKHGIVECILSYLNISADPATLIQGALLQMLEGTKEDFFSNIRNIMNEAADFCYDRIKDIPCIDCPYKPEGSMFIMVKLNMSLLEGIDDDLDFALKLAREESVIVLPGTVVGMNNWVRITYAVERSSLEDGVGRIRSFCTRNSKLKNPLCHKP
ncbi:Aminotransferase, class I/classII [Dillenia turbinata]|uniref:Aminotransferase, class I/classII n=1 Tax=Dillenia turbinata TaxID=194707 RepID=A0AAN8UY97_9MAGN